ncbi:Gp37 family protein [Limnobaculum xujianqingii]|uniref:Gp37 family protein n=1 Tax=Limnobaculum xujianqingii TaxID=2738837 RepID=UPI001C4BD0A5|nr:Gp37 family protein [Limnobaculum xujianqingii]
MSITLDVLDAVLIRLKDAHGKALAIEYFPEQPASYRLNHAVGAVLISYSKSNFNNVEALDSTWMARDMTIPLTLMFRQLHGKKGVIAYLDHLRETLTGWTPPHCDTALKPVSEIFLAQNAGIWQYALDFNTRINQIQVSDETPPHLRYEDYP